MDTKKAQELLAKQQQGTLSPEEQAMLDSWYNQLAAIETEVPQTHLDQKQKAVYNRLLHSTGTGKTLRLWPRIAAAASILLLLSAGGYLLLRPKPAAHTAVLVKNDIAPGHNQATLTLANGKKIILTRGLSGLLALQGKTAINAGGNNIIYTPSKKADQVSYNMLSTAKGEQSPYPLVLADGTKVWLNAESSLTYPTAFNGRERKVTLSGEGYFEVVHNASQPFKVQTTNQTIEDIGTRFDVKSYTDEPAATTLVEGSVKVNNIPLKPGEQFSNDKVQTVNTTRYTAWKNGDFDFEGDNIQTIMRELSRWYNIDVSYEGTPTTGFSAEISRSKNISAVLHMLERTKLVHFKIEERRVTVIK